MKGKTKTQKGITLIALIITIVVLLILAVVAINAIQNDGILGYAQNSSELYNKAQQDEKEILDYYELVLSGKAWVQNGTKVTRGDVTLEVGDNVNYTAGVSGYTDENGWKVLGAENGKLLLVSATNLKKDRLYMTGADAYYNGISTLDEICSAYLNETYASQARSIRIEDINRVTGYNPNKTGTGEPFHAGRKTQYGNTVTFKLENDENGNKVIRYEGTLNPEVSNGTLPFTKFVLVDGTKLAETENVEKKEYTTITLKGDYYWYYPESLSNVDDGPIIGLKAGDRAYDALFIGDYYIASRCLFVNPEPTSGPVFGLWMCYQSSIRQANLWTCIPSEKWPTGAATEAKGVKGVIEILPECELIPNGANNWSLDI